MSKIGVTWILDRLKERSTWLGLLAMLAAFGVTLSPETSSAVVTFALGAAGLVAALTRDKLPPGSS